MECWNSIRVWWAKRQNRNTYIAKGWHGLYHGGCHLALTLHNEDTVYISRWQSPVGDVAVLSMSRAKYKVDLAPRAEELDPEIVEEDG